MEGNPRNSAVPIRAHLASIAVVGNLEGKSSKRPDHFVKIYVDDLKKDVIVSDKKPRIPSPQWEWPETFQFQFHPSSTIKIAIYREKRNRIQKHLIGQYSGKVVDLLENNANIDLEDEAGAEITAKIKVDLSLVSEPEGSFANFMKTVDADVSRLDGAVRAPPGILAFGKALQMTKNILDIVANADPTPILKASLAVMSVVYGAINQAELLDGTVRDLAENLREVLGTAKEYPDSLRPIEGTTNVIEEIGRTSLTVSSLLYEYTRLTYAGRLLKFQLSDDMKSRIAQCQKCLDDLKQKFDRRVNIDTNRQLRCIKDDQLAKTIFEWLSAPDTSRNYNEAREKYQKGTASWFLDGERFRELQEKGDFLWIRGTAGCGKTLLCSSVIEKIIELHKENASIIYAYFFFDGRDSQKDLQLHDKLIRSLISQLSRQCDGIPTPLAELYRSDHGQQPSTNSLQDALHHIVDGLPSVYIIVDSLDECVKSEREKTLQWICQMVLHTNLHMVVASRPERDIIDVLEPLDAHDIDLVKESANHDISMYLEQQVSLLKKWDEETRNIVKSTLTERAHGMFRWVALQLNQLKECSTPQGVREQLNALPRDLHETYDRILFKVDEADRTDTKTFLRWLCFSVRGLTLSEIAEAVVVDMDAENGPRYEPLRRYWDQKDVLVKCSGLITESEGYIKLAHFSIKEYLLSERLHLGPISHFHLSSDELSHSLISQTCLAYILQFDTLDSFEATIESFKFPLTNYVAQNWIFHAQAGGIDKPEPSTTLTLAKRLFAPNEAAFTNWVQSWDLDNDPYAYYPSMRISKRTNIATPLYYASLAGLQQVSLHLLREVNVNALGGKFGNALQAASSRGHEANVRMLLENGADPNAQGGEYGNALQAAAGHESHTWLTSLSPEHEAQAIAKLLLEHGADPNVQGGKYGNALLAASFCGHKALAKLLLENGADANAQGGKYGNALQAASFSGNIAIVKLLLENGADLNTQGGEYGNALQAMSLHGNEVGVKLLLEHGADVNDQGGNYGNALQAASFGGHEAIVALLLENGANVNIQGGEYGTALHAAASREVHSWSIKPILGHDAVVKLLLEHGADPNAMGGEYGHALQAASLRGHEAIVKLLLENGADPNARGGKCGNALQAASLKGHKAVVMLLLQNRADPNAQGGEYGNALQAASSPRYENDDYDYGRKSEPSQEREVIIKLLLEHGANPNAQGGTYSNALQAASFRGEEVVVKLLLDHGADPNVQGGSYGNILQVASFNGHIEIVKLLLERGVDPNVQGGIYGNALQAAASHRGYSWSDKPFLGHDVVKLLLKHGANPNAQGGQYGNALQAASIGGQETTVKLLLKNGVDPRIQGGKYGNALQAASFNGHSAIVKLLLQNGVDMNAQGGKCGNALNAALLRNHERDDEDFEWRFEPSQEHEVIAKLLLDHGADPTAQDAKYGNALQAASFGGQTVLVKLLLEKGMDPNTQGGKYGNALQTASYRGHEAIVKLLLENGADPNMPGGEYGNALQAAAGYMVDIPSWIDPAPESDAIAKLLLENGADPNARGGRFGTALQAASFRRHELNIVLLLEHGADVNVQGGEYGNALQAASYGGPETIVRLLLKNGADPNAQGGEYGTALQAASSWGPEANVKLLLENGADPNAQGGKYGNALHAASYWTNEVIVELLLQNGADPKAQGGEYGNALQAVGSRERYDWYWWKGTVQQITVLKLLLEHEVDVNAYGGKYGSALQAASFHGHEAMVRLLLEHGADVNVQGGEYGSALKAASAQQHDAIVKLLQERGAEVGIPS